MPSGGGVLQGVCGDAAGRAGAVVDDDRLPKALPQGVGDQARDDVGLPAGRDRDENPDGLLGRTLGVGGRGRERGEHAYSQ